MDWLQGASATPVRGARRPARVCSRTSRSCAASRTAAGRSSPGERWALTGEAGLFLDPFYSPGSDFIGIANTYICELVGRDRAGRPIDAHAQVFDQIYHSFYESTLALYEGAVPDLRRPRGAAGEGDLGLHVLLGRAGAVLLPAPPRRPRLAVGSRSPPPHLEDRRSPFARPGRPPAISPPPHHPSPSLPPLLSPTPPPPPPPSARTSFRRPLSARSAERDRLL